MLDFCGEASSSSQSFGETVVEGTGAMMNSWLLLSPGATVTSWAFIAGRKNFKCPLGTVSLRVGGMNLWLIEQCLVWGKRQVTGWAVHVPCCCLVLYSVQFNCSVLSNSATPWIAAHQASLSITKSRSLPKLMSIESVMPSNHPSSVVLFSSCPQSFPASGSFWTSQLFASGGRSIGVSASTSVFPMNTQDLSPLGWTGWISLQSKGLSSVFSNTTLQKRQFFGTQFSSQSNSHIHTWPLEKP